jgi:hypothetical protein
VLAQIQVRDTIRDNARVLAQPYTTRLFQKLPRARRDMVYRHLDTKTPIGDVYFRPTNLGEVDFEHEEDLAGCFKTHQSEIGYLGKDIITKLADRGTSRIYLF